MTASSPSPARPPVILIIRDGWGENPHPEHDAFNAVKIARKPVDDMLRRDWPTTLITTSGEDVGLPKGTMGNSEVGHQNIGAGRIVDQEVMRITRAIRDGSFFVNSALRGAFEHARSRGTNVHIMGLVSDGQVHSDLDHLFALIDLAKREGFPGERLFIHVFTDGRDTGPRTGLGYVERLEAKLRDAGVGRIATVIGRFYSMDRDHRWERVQRAYQLLTGRSTGSGGPPIRTADSAREAIEWAYANPIDANRQGDEFIPPTRVKGVPGTICDSDAAIFFNFRGDRPREITKAFVLDDQAWRNVQGGGFDRGPRLANLYFCGMTGYEAGLPMTAVAFDKPPRMVGILGEAVSKHGLTQFRCAETEKFPHVTFFFNDYREEPFPGERRLLCPSPRDVSTYDQKPEMSAPAVCEGVLQRLAAPDCEALLVINFANPDMVGHTGNLHAAVKAVEVVDACVGRIIEAALKRGASLVITADHGNAEQMWSPEHNAPHTAHTVYDVPLHVVGEPWRGRPLRPGGRLADVAPTVLALMGLPQPPEMTGRCLLGT
ncbi:MAG: 2,3-bisphosphoglycerate-independent phosphoglycerate mutase [Phycisphaeraceae bacterium]|nr:MAG: 2,3-bisphosphoglycerate-independent phosphoglycerate mutase [Phycisphaeraceae bacterium]